MDGMDSFIFSLVLIPALRDVLPSSGIAATTANVGYYSGLLFALFMVGWGVALVWGPIADRFGRARTLMFSILWFSFFTLLAALCHNVWSLAIVRFMAGVGIGGEWSIGASLVSEEWPETRRMWGVCLMHTGYYIGFVIAALANYFIGSQYGWRWMFVVGGVPAIIVAPILVMGGHYGTSHDEVLARGLIPVVHDLGEIEAFARRLDGDVTDGGQHARAA